MSQKTISILEFSRRIGIGEKTVRDAIRLGKIIRGVDNTGKKPKIIFDVAIKEVEALGIGYRSKFGKEETIDPPSKEEVTEDSTTDEDIDCIAGLTPETSLATAQRAEKIFKAQLASLEVDEKAGILVKKDDVYNQLFTFGSEVKNAMMAIPDRITDELISVASDRDKFYELLSKSIIDALEILSSKNDAL